MEPLPRLSSLPGTRRIKKLPKVQPPRRTGPANVGNDAVADFRRKLGDDTPARRLATRVYNLLQKYTNATIPECIAYDYLERTRLPFTFQASLFGGRSVQGGLVPDFLINNRGVGVVWLVQSDYYHKLLGVKQRDAAAKVRMRGAVLDGLVIEQVIEIWERRILSPDRDSIFNFALAGIELGQ